MISGDMPTINMSDIPRVWSPEPGPEQRTTGLKTIHGTVYGVFRESLVGLHDSAWWTGFQLKCPDAPDTEFYVRLMSDIGVEQPFSITTAWTQKASDWQPLPWAIPPKLATFLRLYLEITPLPCEGPQGPMWVSRRLGFHELGQNVSPDGRYKFVHADGQICAIWDERFSAWATKKQGYVAHWGSAYYVVPPLRDFLMHNMPWVDGRTHCLLNWDECVKLV
jgi:hypothetical protein